MAPPNVTSVRLLGSEQAIPWVVDNNLIRIMIPDTVRKHLPCAHAYVFKLKCDQKTARDRRLKVLLIDGQNNHNWRATTPIAKQILEDSGRFAVEVSTTPPADGQTPETPSRNTWHFRDWLDACKGGPAPSANFEYGARITEMVLLGNVALRSGVKIEWDAVNMKVTNTSKADNLLKEEYRKGWEIV